MVLVSLTVTVPPQSRVSAQEATCPGGVISKTCPENFGTTTAITNFSITDETVSSIVLSGGDADLFVLELGPAETINEGRQERVPGKIFFRLSPDFENPLDADGDNVYRTNIVAFDGNNTNTFPFTATVTNVDEEGEMTFSSRQPEQGTPFTATLTDPEGASGVSWVWEESADGSTNWSTISNAATNVFTPSAANLNNWLRATATYSDSFGSGKTAQAISEHEVHEPHDDNHAPAFPTSENGVRYIDENSPEGTNVGAPVAAADDEHAADVLTYDLGGMDADSFDIDRNSGQLLTKADLNFEEKDRYLVTVTVTDPSLATAEKTVGIFLNNLDEDAVLMLSTPTPGEGERIDAVLVDPDGETTNEIWVWARSADGVTNWSNISGAMFDNYVAASDDLDNYLRATVTYTDPHGAGKRAESISLNPVHEPPDHVPYFARDETFRRSIAEDAPIGSAVGDPFRAFDEDGHDITFFLIDPPADLPFELDPVSGQMRTTALLDFERSSQYVLTIAIHDAGHDHVIGDHSSDATGQFVVSILNVKETDARLSELSLTGLTLSPEFSPDRYVYTAEVPVEFEQTVVDFATFLPDTAIDVSVDNIQHLSTLPLDGSGPFLITIVATTFGDDDVRIYEVVVTKPGDPRIVAAGDETDFEFVHDADDAEFVFEAEGIGDDDLLGRPFLNARVFRRHTKERVEECEGAGFGVNQPFESIETIALTVSADCPIGRYSIDIRLWGLVVQERIRIVRGVPEMFIFSGADMLAYGSFALDVTHSRGTHVAAINRIEADIETVTVSPGDDVRLGVNIYGRQEILDNDHGDLHSFLWRDGDAGGTFSSDERRVVYTVPEAPGAYKITASIDRDECKDQSVESCTATFRVIVKRRAETSVEIPEPVNPQGEIPNVLVDSEGIAYEVFTPVDGGTYFGDGYGLTAPPGAVADGEFIGISVLPGDEASNLGQAHLRYTIGGHWYHVRIADGSVDAIDSYRLHLPAEVCIPLPAELMSNISDLALVAEKEDAYVVLGSRIVLSLDGDTRICGRLSELPADVVAAKFGAPGAPPREIASAAGESLPDTGGGVPDLRMLLGLLVLAVLALASAIMLDLARKRRRVSRR